MAAKTGRGGAVGISAVVEQVDRLVVKVQVLSLEQVPPVHVRPFGRDLGGGPGRDRGGQDGMPPPPAEATAELDDLAQPGPKLAATTALLVDDIAQAFGVPEMPQLSHDGQLRRRYWSYPQMITWAEENGITNVRDTGSAAGLRRGGRGGRGSGTR